MRQLLAVVALCILAARLVEASLASTHPISLLAPVTVGAATACAMCVGHLFREDA